MNDRQVEFDDDEEDPLEGVVIPDSESTSLTRVEPARVPVPVSEYALNVAKQKYQTLNDIYFFCLSQLKPKDINKIHGNPYITAKAYQKIARALGISIAKPEFRPKVFTTYPDGQHYLIQVIVKGSWKISTPEGIFECDEAYETGSASSKDDWFKETVMGPDGKAKKDELGKVIKVSPPWHEINEKNVIAKAYTNAIRRLITTITGYDNPTWEQLKSYAKITPEMVKGFEEKLASDGQISFCRTLLEKKISDTMPEFVEKHLEMISSSKAQRIINYLKDSAPITMQAFENFIEGSNKAPTGGGYKDVPANPKEKASTPPKKPANGNSDLTQQLQAIENMLKMKNPEPDNCISYAKTSIKNSALAGEIIGLLNKAADVTFDEFKAWIQDSPNNE